MILTELWNDTINQMNKNSVSHFLNKPQNYIKKQYTAGNLYVMGGGGV